MNQLTSQQRKLLYLIGIIALLIPIIVLGRPASGKTSAADAKADPGGLLSQKRSEYDLGESDLGELDASGAAINLVLLGMRGVAVNLLWIELDQQKDMKRWAEMQATTKSIVRLQPHYEKVWDMNGWNLAYNTSAEWDAVPDRYYWVKEGAKLLKQGVARNVKATELYYRVGKVFQQKIGYADEAADYRKYFLNDPDPAFEGKGDPELNPDNDDNFLVAKKWYTWSVERDVNRPQHILDHSLFVATPTRCQFDFAQALQKDGKFGEETRKAWEDAQHEWTESYGKMPIHAVIGSEESDIHLEMTDDDIKQVAKTPDDELRVRRHVDQYQKMCNYRYWRMRAYAEAEHETAEAHRTFFDSKQAFRNQDFDKAKDAAFKGMEGFDKILMRPEYKELADEDILAEECLLGWKIWDDIHQLRQEKIPEEFPLKWLVQAKQSNDQVMQQVTKQFNRLLGNR
jgi:hypothetical protein